MIKISVCMIVKNEEKVLSRCLDCVKKFADEIIIVDTGSTDKTLDIAKNYTDKVYKIWWQNNFSIARNFSFSKATKEYIMWLDADDIIHNSEIDKIKKLKQTLSPEIDIVMMKYTSGDMFFYRERLIKNNPNQFRWHGFVHEVIPLSGNIIYKEITVTHEKPHQKNYSKRNLKIYELAKKQHKNFSNRDTYYYARELYYHKKYSKAITNFKSFLQNENKNICDEYEAMILISDCYLGLHKHEKALQSLLELCIQFPPSSKVCYKLGNLFFNKNNIETAIFWYELATQNLNNQYHTFYESVYSNILPYLQLCVCYYKIGDIKNSKKYHLLAKNINPNNESVIFNHKFFNI